MRAHIALLWLVALGCTAACSADFGANHSTRCDETALCPITETCYRGFCVQGPGFSVEVDGSLSPITEVEAGVTPALPGGGEGGTATVLADAQSPTAVAPPGTGDGDASAANDGGPWSVLPGSPDDAAAPAPGPATPPTTTPTPVDPAPVTPAPTTPEPTAPAPTTPAPTTPAPTTPAPEPTPPVTPTPVIDAGAPETSVPPAPTPPQTTEPPQSSPLVLCLAVCLTRSSLCLTCLAGSINNDPSVCDERQVRGDRELRELCDWLCAGSDCGGAR